MVNFWSANAPNYSPPAKGSPSWVWSIVGEAMYSSGVKCSIIRFDLCVINAQGVLVKHSPNVYFGPMGQSYSSYAPIFICVPSGNEGHPNTYASSSPSSSINSYWRTFVWKMLYTMVNANSTQGWVPLNVPAPI